MFVINEKKYIIIPIDYNAFFIRQKKILKKLDIQKIM